ncbi:MAG TPA: metallophosphoesterase [Thermomicrobiales bacterium]|nr:metallophosphoesterase [Thermomicrobiales bacterium]
MTERLRLGVLTDLHLAPAGSPPRKFINPYPFERSLAMLDDALAWFGEGDINAVAVLGDLVMFEDEASLEAGMTRIAALGKPVLIVPGNHDGVDWPASIARNLPNQALPDWPAVVRAVDVVVKQEPERWWTGGIRLPEAGPALVLSHFPLVDVGGYLTDAGFPYAGDATWDDSRTGIQDRADPIVALSGHVHVRYERAEGAVLQLGFAALIEPPHAAAILDLRDDGDGLLVTVDHTDIAPYDVDLVPIISPSTSTWRFADGGWKQL